MPALGDEIIAGIRESVPEYARPLKGSFGRGVRQGVAQALKRFVDDIEEPGADPAGWRAVYFNLGRGELRQGRSLEALLAAYRVGARVSWRHLADAAQAAGASSSDIAALAEAIFAYIDELSAISAEGFAAEQAQTAGEVQRRRETVLRLLVEGTATREALADAAARAGWELPATAAAVIAREERPGSLATRLGADVIAAVIEEGVTCAVVPDAEAPGRRSELDAALSGRNAAVGPSFEPLRFRASIARARLALELREDGVLNGDPVHASDQLPALIVHADRGALAEHAERALAPLDELSDAARRRLLQTLIAWIAHPGRPTEVARAVHVHPQTARYRLRQLRELLGDLDDPEFRFELALALRATDVLDADREDG